MPFLSPAKILVILVVALVVLGPDKLPKVARQVGGLWSDFRRYREKLESDVRGTFPDLPSSEAISHAMRSPLTFLNTLADSHGEAGPGPETGVGDLQPSESIGAPAGSPDRLHQSGSDTEETSDDPGASIAVSGGVLHRVRSNDLTIGDDPSLN